MASTTARRPILRRDLDRPDQQPPPDPAANLWLIYQRQSEMRPGDLYPDGTSKALVEGERVLCNLVAAKGGTVVDVIVENDLTKSGRLRPASAYKRRKVVLPDGTTAERVIRPGFRRLLDLLLRRTALNVAAIDLDRIARDNRDMEDYIDVMQMIGGNSRSITGTLTFTDGGTSDERVMARMLVTMAQKSSSDTARRVSSARLRQALNGEWAGGARRYGREVDGITLIPEEVDVIVRCVDDVLGGVPTRALVRDLNREGIPATKGGPWSSRSLRDMLLRPSNAGHAVYQGEIVATPWPTIIPDDLWQTVCEVLTDPERTQSGGRVHEWQGTGLYRCYCGARVQSRHARSKSPGYKCPEYHTARVAREVDEAVGEAIIERLKRPDAAGLLAEPVAGLDLNALRAEARDLRRYINETLSDMLGQQQMTRAQYTRAKARAQERLDEVTRLTDSATAVTPYAKMILSDDPRSVWQGMPIGVRRTVIETLRVNVVIKPATSQTFSLDDIEVTFG